MGPGLHEEKKIKLLHIASFFLCGFLYCWNPLFNSEVNKFTPGKITKSESVPQQCLKNRLETLHFWEKQKKNLNIYQDVRVKPENPEKDEVSEDPIEGSLFWGVLRIAYSSCSSQNGHFREQTPLATWSPFCRSDKLFTWVRELVITPC